MGKERPGFMLYFQDIDSLNKLGDACFGRLVRGMGDYARTGKRPELSNPVADTAFSMLAFKLDHDRERYEKRVESGRNAANARWKREKAEADSPERAVAGEGAAGAPGEAEGQDGGARDGMRGDAEACGGNGGAWVGVRTVPTSASTSTSAPTSAPTSPSASAGTSSLRGFARGCDPRVAALEELKKRLEREEARNYDQQ